MTSTPGAARRVRAIQTGAARSHQPLPTRVDGLPELPPEFGDTLERGLRSLGLEALPIATRDTIDDHVRLLLAWSEAINLTAITRPEDVAREHVLDSLTAVPLLRSVDATRIVDLGSGGGFPGIPIALTLEPERVLLVDSVGKKARFLAAVAAALGERAGPQVARRLSIAATRAERLAADPHHRGRWNVVVARAVGSVAELAELSLPLLVQGGHLVAWKKEPLSAELEAAAKPVERIGGFIAGVEPVPIEGLEDHRLVVVSKVSPTPAVYPRDPAIRKRRPW